MDNISFHSGDILLAETQDNGNLRLKFALCDFSVNLNRVQLNRERIDGWVGTLVNQPLVGKIVKSPFSQKEDFAGHEMRKTFARDDAGNLVQTYTFFTQAFGTFVSAAVEEIDGNEYVTGIAEVWGRFQRTIRLIKDRMASGVLRTSWEIEALEYTKTEDGVKVIDNGLFRGLCLLGASTQAAYPESSRLLDVAEVVDDELVSALNEDMKELEMKKDKKTEVAEEEAQLEQMPAVPEATAESSAETAPERPESERVSAEDAQAEDIRETENEPENCDQAGHKNAEGAQMEERGQSEGRDEKLSAENTAEINPVEQSSLTTRDLRHKIYGALREKFPHEWYEVNYVFPEEHVFWAENECRESDLDYMMFAYEVAGDAVVIDDGTPVKLTVSVASINEVMAQKDAAIAAALAENEELKAQVAELREIKTKYDAIQEANAKAEAEAKKDALRSYAMKSGLFTEGELAKGNAKRLIDALDQAGINQMIADRYMAKLAQASAAQAEVEISEAKKPAYRTDAVNLSVEDVKPVRFNAVRAFIEN